MTAATGHLEPRARKDMSELLRAFGAAALNPPTQSQHVFDALELPRMSPAQYTDAFVLSLPPHAAIHLGVDGKLGGDAFSRIRSFWHVLGLDAPADPDHLGLLLMLYAELTDAELESRTAVGRQRLAHVRSTLLNEHIWSWAPGYLTAVGAMGVTPVTAWAAALLEALRIEVVDSPAALLPVALRSCPPPGDIGADLDDLLDVLLAPIKSGIVLTRHDLVDAAAFASAGYRHGERRYTLKALLQQEPDGIRRWLVGHARRWVALHRAQAIGGSGDPSVWWTQRAEATCALLAAL